MNSFFMNGDIWHIAFVDPASPKLVDRTRTYRLATTDPNTGYIYLSNTLNGDMLNRVLIHELGHCAMFSFGLLNAIHRMVRPKYWIDMEEWICNFIADYGYMIFSVAYSVLGDDAWICIPAELERFIA